MKKKGIILVLVGILAVGSMSLAYGASVNCTSLNNFKGQMMRVQSNDGAASPNRMATMMGRGNYGAQSNDNYNKMVQIMKENGFIDEANAMENRDFNAMSKLMASISDEDYKKMIDIMQNNGYGPMANMMKSTSREDMIKFHQSMMGK